MAPESGALLPRLLGSGMDAASDDISASQLVHVTASKLISSLAISNDVNFIPANRLEADFDEAVAFLRDEIVGRNRILDGPLGPRMKIYMDWTASGQGLHFVSRYINWVRENFANSHTEDSATGRFMTEVLRNALKSIERCVNAQDKFVAICLGTGCTGAMMRLQQILGIYVSPASWKRIGVVGSKHPHRVCAQEPVSLKVIPNFGCGAGANELSASNVKGKVPEWLQARERVKNELRNRAELPLVLVGGYEHHSNEISWREGLCDVERVPLTNSFELDLDILDKLLQAYRRTSSVRLIIGCFSACSNVTGMRTNIGAVSRLLRKAGAYFFVDFAASAPYEDIDCCPKDEESVFDGFVASPHKFLGGDGSCGLLMLRKSVYDLQLPPTFGGGGTVKFVGQTMHSYSDDIAERENAGTPGVLQILQCALAFEIKEALGPKRIEERERALLADFFAWLKDKFPVEVLVMGNLDPELRHAIVSFNIVGPWQLHPRFVTVLLNDLFGVQTRAGCSCAGPHGVDLSGAGRAREAEWASYVVGESLGREDEIEDVGLYSTKFGWCRFNLHYTMDAHDIEYFKDALSFVVQHGHRFLSVYSFDAVSGDWVFRPPETFKVHNNTVSSTGSQQAFGLKTALEGGISRTVMESNSCQAVRQGHFKSAYHLLSLIPEDLNLKAPPAPFPLIKFPCYHGKSFFVVCDGMVHNLEEMKRCVTRHSEQLRTDMLLGNVLIGEAQVLAVEHVWVLKPGLWFREVLHSENDKVVRAHAGMLNAVVVFVLTLSFAANMQLSEVDWCISDLSLLASIGIIALDVTLASAFGLAACPLGAIATLGSVHVLKDAPEWTPARPRRLSWFVQSCLVSMCLVASVLVSNDRVRLLIVSSLAGISILLSFLHSSSGFCIGDALLSAFACKRCPMVQPSDPLV